MTRESAVFKGLEKAFLPALLLTGSVEGAEAAVLDGIAALESDPISRDSLLLRTVRSAIHCTAIFRTNARQLSQSFLLNFDACFCLPRTFAAHLYCGSFLA